MPGLENTSLFFLPRNLDGIVDARFLGDRVAYRISLYRTCRSGNPGFLTCPVRTGIAAPNEFVNLDAATGFSRILGKELTCPRGQEIGSPIKNSRPSTILGLPIRLIAGDRKDNTKFSSNNRGTP